MTLQTGGSDQWGNLTAGIDLVRRVEGAAVHALSTPLVTKSDGTKMGKTEGGSVWLDPSLTSPYAFFQFWLNADDADARAWLPLFSERPADGDRGADRRERRTPGGPDGPAGAGRGAHPAGARAGAAPPGRGGRAGRCSAGTTSADAGGGDPDRGADRGRQRSPWTARCRRSPSCSS